MRAIRAGILWLASVTGAHACVLADVENHARWAVLNHMPVLSDGLHERGARTIHVLAVDEDIGAAVDDLGDLIAFCRPRAWAAETCFCSVEWIETLITADAFVLQMTQRRAVGAASAVELRATIKNAAEVCGERVEAAPVEALGAAARQIEPSPAPRQTGAVHSSRARAP